MKIVFAITIFFLVLIVFELLYSLFRKPAARSVGKVAKQYSPGLGEDEEVDILYYRKFSDIKAFDTLLSRIPAVGKLDELMQQGGVKTLAGVFILFVLTLGAMVFMVCTSLFQMKTIIAVVASIGVMLLPYFYLLYKRMERSAKFESLFPDALDIMSYSLKAGHSIMASFKMVADEMPDPIGEEFGRIVEEINFGRDLDTCLRNFSRRIDSPELRFFATSVIIQRETGGNLVEMIEKISEVIRRKFRFREKVKTLSAEGKISAAILLALPFVAGAAIFILNPEYIQVLMTDPIGPYAIAIALTMMSIGSLIMYKLVQLDL